jgi:tRNA A58 N-methylase Trm61
MFTYPFAYYLQPNNQVAIFELNQEMLAKAVEELSGRLEDEDLSKRDITEQRCVINDLM